MSLDFGGHSPDDNKHNHYQTCAAPLISPVDQADVKLLKTWTELK